MALVVNINGGASVANSSAPLDVRATDDIPLCANNNPAVAYSTVPCCGSTIMDVALRANSNSAVANSTAPRCASANEVAPLFVSGASVVSTSSAPLGVRVEESGVLNNAGNGGSHCVTGPPASMASQQVIWERPPRCRYGEFYIDMVHAQQELGMSFVNFAWAMERAWLARFAFALDTSTLVAPNM